jgi:hypothetical protein
MSVFEPRAGNLTHASARISHKLNYPRLHTPACHAIELEKVSIQWVRGHWKSKDLPRDTNRQLDDRAAPVAGRSGGALSAETMLIASAT